jgi:hypothetical protein
VRATQSSAAATGSGLLRRSFAGISVQAIGAAAGGVPVPQGGGGIPVE